MLGASYQVQCWQTVLCFEIRFFAKPETAISLILLCFIFSCKKIDSSSQIKIDVSIDAFLAFPQNSSPELKLIVADLRKQLSRKNFAGQFQLWHGIPLWDKAIKLKKSDKEFITLLIPTLKNGEIVTFIAASIKPDAKVVFELHRQSSIDNNLLEYSYIKINPRKAKSYLALFKILNTEGQAGYQTPITPNSLVDDDCSFTWWQWQICPPSFSKNADDSTGENATISIPQYCWVQHTYEWPNCEPGTGNPPGGGGGGGGCSNCPLPPDCPDPLWYSFVPIEDPCEEEPTPNPPTDSTCIKAMSKSRKMDSLYLKCKVDSVLNTIPNLATEALEKGFAMIKKKQTDPYDPNIFTFTNHYCNNVQTGTDSSITVEFTLGYREFLAGIFHTHPGSGYTAQSAKDIYSLIEASADSNPCFEGNMIRAYDGSEYAVTISDPTLAAAFLQTKTQFLHGAKWNEDSEIGKAFKDAKDYFKTKVFKNNVNKNNLSYEMAMSAVLKQFNTGITLHKKNISGHFEPLIVSTFIPDPNKPKKKVYTRDCVITMEP